MMNKTILGLIALGLILLSGIYFFIYFPSFKTPVLQTTPAPAPSPAPTEVSTNWQTYQNPDHNLKFQYPFSLDKFVNSKQFSLSVKSKTNIEAEYVKYQQEGGCPSTCGQLAEDSSLLQKQFDLLTQISDQSNCTPSENYQTEVKKDFILFTGGIGNKLEVTGLKTNDGRCILKFIESDGFDVSLSNFYYKVGFIQNDQVFQIMLPLFPIHAFDKIDQLWTSFGYDLESGSCDATCYDKQSQYFESFDLKNNDLASQVITAYDQVLATLELKN